jgi:hypothetical protein
VRTAKALDEILAVEQHVASRRQLEVLWRVAVALADGHVA